MSRSVYIIIIAALFVGSLSLYLSKNEMAEEDVLVSCTLEARMCPDGSAVGRSGPSCLFLACPPAAVGLGEEIVFGDTTVTPIKVTEDSRCPVDAQCIWAGTFMAEVEISSDTTQEVRQMSIGDLISTSFGPVVLDAVTPDPTTRGIAASAYKLIFVEE